MRNPVLPAALLLAIVATSASLFAAPGRVLAQCATDPQECVTYSPSAAAPGTVVTITPAAGQVIPVIDSDECAVDARVNIDFIRGGVVVALSPLTGTNERARFRVPSAAPGTYRVDLYCPQGDHAATIANFRILAPDTSTIGAVPLGGSGTNFLVPLVAMFALAFAFVLLLVRPIRAAAATLTVRHVAITGPSSTKYWRRVGGDPGAGLTTPRPRSSLHAPGPFSPNNGDRPGR